MLASRLICIYFQSNSVPLAPVHKGKNLRKFLIQKFFYFHLRYVVDNLFTLSLLIQLTPIQLLRSNI